MGGAMGTFFWSLTAAFVVAMTTLAYRKPKEYSRFLIGILLLLVAVIAGGMIYGAGYQNGALDTQRYLSKHEGGYYESEPFPFDGTAAFFLGWGLGLYLIVLAYLPSILGTMDEGADRNGKDAP
ncbi:hypothetical protein [Aquamicrobium soli]|jgi:hypothetical protein|uniref:Uncharacterized protein n=1 Tax=Aquamicrobium soli TaxID=1811518 RepID=A0ABV7K7G8_9HYPH